MENIKLQKNFGNVAASLNFNFPAYFGIPESKSDYSEHKYKPGIKYLLENWLSVDEVAALFSEAISEAQGKALECLNKALKVFEDMTEAKEDPFTKAWKRGYIEDKGVDNRFIRYSNTEENVSILSDCHNAVIITGAKYGDYNTIKHGKYRSETKNSGRVLQVLNYTIEKAVKIAEFRTLKELKKEYGSLLAYNNLPYNMKPYFKYLEDKPTYFGATPNENGWMVLKQEKVTILVGSCGKELQEDFHYYREVKPEEE